MLTIDTEFRKGILFVRLNGIFNKQTKQTFENEVSDIIKKNGIRYLVINCSELIDIDIKGINTIINDYKQIYINNGKTLICGLKDNQVKYKLKHSPVFNFAYETSNELTALNIVNY